jgi:predicted short-subunit dehydrogenase-like oxidoreductase (DUF2520 family)
MTERINLADPDFEPTDVQLTGLAARAFADVVKQHQAALVKLRAEIRTARERALAILEEQRTTARNAK